MSRFCSLLTRQYTKNPELCSVLGWERRRTAVFAGKRCGDEFGLELNWNGTLNPVL